MAKNTKQSKLYDVKLGLIDEDGDETINWSSKTVVAKDAAEAIKRCSPKKGEYVVGVILVSAIDRA